LLMLPHLVRKHFPAPALGTAKEDFYPEDLSLESMTAMLTFKMAYLSGMNRWNQRKPPCKENKGRYIPSPV
jgi:hypothetical protein